jgi:hypothetical protein
MNRRGQIRKASCAGQRVSRWRTKKKGAHTPAGIMLNEKNAGGLEGPPAEIIPRFARVYS